MNGFLGTGGTFQADLNLVLQLLMGLALLAGWRLARRQKFRAHMYCQSAVIALNLVLIVMIMLPVFNRQVQPQIPEKLHRLYYGVATTHAGLGMLAELFGIYLVLVAATKLLPEALKIKKYKVWMRTELILWWIVLLFGIGTYYYWYGAPAQPQPVPAASQPNLDAARVTVKIVNFSFEPKEITITAGTTVEWIDEKGQHSLAADDGSFESDILEAGGRFAHKYERPGIYPYYCPLHGNKGGQEMAGTVKVEERK